MKKQKKEKPVMTVLRTAMSLNKFTSYKEKGQYINL